MKSVMMNLQTADGVGFFGDGGSFFLEGLEEILFDGSLHFW